MGRNWIFQQYGLNNGTATERREPICNIGFATFYYEIN